MKKLSDKDIKDILFLSKQGNGRHNLICNLYKLSKEELYKLLNNVNYCNPRREVGK